MAQAGSVKNSSPYNNSGIQMGYITIGINHKTAPISLREQLSFPLAQLPEALHDARHYIKSREMAILSTCNRTELYCAGTIDPSRALGWLSHYQQAEPNQIHHHAYTYREQDAIRHIMRVACGLDSMVLGEPQILGQLKSAYATACQAGTTGAWLNRLFQHSFATAKQVRTLTTIGRLPVSIAYAATRLAQQIFSDLSENTALLIGAGETTRLVARHLRSQGLQRIIVANRTLDHAKTLTREFGGSAILLSDLPPALPEADIVISATASQTPVLGKGTVEKALKARKHRPMLMVDIAVPRDIEPEVGELSDIFLYTVDDLQNVIANNLQQRQGAVDQAENLIESGLLDFMAQLRSLDAVTLLRRYREHNEQLRHQEVTRALQALAQGQPAEAVVTRLAHSLTNKISHTPSIQLKKAAASGQQERLEWASELFGLGKSPERH